MSDRETPGITRKKVEIPAEKKGDKPTISWDYFLPNGKNLNDKERIEFLNSLAVPPAWTDVWFCSNKNGHIQATGKDANGRLQYRYHPKWIDYKSKLKYANIDEFAAELDSLRDLVKEDLSSKEMSKNKVAALVVWLIDRYHIRVGSDQYAQENESYGLTTLKESHITYKRGEKAIVEGMRVLKGSNKPLPKINPMMKVTGKSGKDW